MVFGTANGGIQLVLIIVNINRSTGVAFRLGVDVQLAIAGGIYLQLLGRHGAAVGQDEVGIADDVEHLA